MEKMVGFLKLYFPVFLLGAVFGKLIELSGFSQVHRRRRSSRLVGQQRAMLSIVLVCALLTYGGVSLFVVVFAVYPFAAEMFRQGDIPKRLIPRHHRARRVHVHHGFAARHAADPEHHPDHLLRHQHLGGAVAGHDRRACSSSRVGLAYLEWRRRAAPRPGEGYGGGLQQRTGAASADSAAQSAGSRCCRWSSSAWRTCVFTDADSAVYGAPHEIALAGLAPAAGDARCRRSSRSGRSRARCSLGILTVLAFAWKPVIGEVRRRHARPRSAARCWRR